MGVGPWGVSHPGEPTVVSAGCGPAGQHDAAFDEAKVFPGKSRLDDGRIAGVKHFVRDKISQGSEDLLKNLKHVIKDTSYGIHGQKVV